MDYKKMVPTGVEITPDTARVQLEYYKIIFDMFGITPTAAMRCGAGGGEFFDAEFQLQGVAAYTNSLMLPLRNIFYRGNNVDLLWQKFLENSPLPEPIVDFGAGVGILCAKLINMGKVDVYAVELPGVQHRVLSKAAETFGFEVIDHPLLVNPRTIISINVLEHLPNPLESLNSWYAAGVEYVYANCDPHDQADHIASQEERQLVRDLLNSKGTFIGGYHD